MLLIGMLHHRKDPNKVVKAYAFSAVAMAEGHQLVYFTPAGIDFDRKVIHGHIYQEGEWRRTDTPFPHVVCNTGSPEKLLPAKKILNRLESTMPFTTHSIGNKLMVYERLKASGEFAAYLIPSHNIHSVRGFFNELNYYHKIIFKPVNGQKGRDILLIETVGRGYRVLSGSEFISLDDKGLEELIKTRLGTESYLIQPYINCRTKGGCAYDIRLHVQKDGSGKWVITSIYPRFGPSGSVVSNINHGGSVNYLTPFLKQEFGEEYFNVKRYLEHFSLRLAEHLDGLQREAFGEVLDELGIDVGLDDMGKIWIYEVNWRPGCPPSFYLELDSVTHMIRYAAYLARKQR